MLDARTSAPDDWNAADIQAVCARGTGIGADGIVFVGPGSQPGAARMIYYNADGSHAAMCGNAALCSTTLAVHLGLGSPDGMHLETDAGTYRSRTAGPDTGRAELRLAAVEPPATVRGLALADGERRAGTRSVAAWTQPMARGATRTATGTAPGRPRWLPVVAYTFSV